MIYFPNHAIDDSHINPPNHSLIRTPGVRLGFNSGWLVPASHTSIVRCLALGSSHFANELPLIR